MTKLISVIIPVYNAEKYLRKCLDSIVNQTYKNLEIILVDDGSTDSSYYICCEYQKIDKRIKVLQQENKGAAAARNRGLDICKGDYIGFVDSDDFIDADMYDELIKGLTQNNAQSAQILSRRITDDDLILNIDLIRRTENSRSVVYSPDEAIEHYLIGNHSLCSHLYDSTLFKSVRIPEGMSGEDLAIIIPLYCQCNKVVKINQYKYNYRFNQNSVTNSQIDQRKINLFYEYERQLYEYRGNKLYRRILIYKMANTLASIVNSLILSESNSFDHDEKYFKKKIIEYFNDFEVNDLINKAQMRKFKLYLRSRFLYRIMLIIKRKYFHRRLLYGEE